VGRADSRHGLGRLDANDSGALRDEDGEGGDGLGEQGESAEGKEEFLHFFDLPGKFGRRQNSVLDFQPSRDGKPSLATIHVVL
jgi:hypothetical protein